VHVEAAEKQEPVTFRPSEQRCIVCDLNFESSDKQSEIGAFCFAQECFLFTRVCLVFAFNYPV